MKSANLMIAVLALATGMNSMLHAFPVAGDIAFTGFNSDNPDEFSFIILKDIPAGTVIHFTECGWSQDHSFRSGESTMHWTSELPTAAGTLVHISSDRCNLQLNSDGDQILAYTGEEPHPVFIAAIHFDGSSGWGNDATDSHSSALPDGLINNSTALALNETSNALYIGDFRGSPEELLQKINNPMNWNLSNNHHFMLNPQSFPYNLFFAGEGNWETSANWKTGVLPNDQTSVIIPESAEVLITSQEDRKCKNLIMEPRSKMTIGQGQTLVVSNNLYIQSRTASYSGSLLCQGTLQVNGTTIFERWIPDKNRHLVSSPVSGQPTGEFLLSNSIDYDSAGCCYKMALFDEALNAWNYCTYDSAGDEIIAGQGYDVCRSSAGSANGILQFRGRLQYTGIEKKLFRNGDGWNCIGNPFASAINGTGDGSFLSLNSDQLDPEYRGLYFWDAGMNDYDVMANPGALKIAPGQGFMVKAKSGEGKVLFPANLQVHSAGTFKSSAVSWPAISITVSCNDQVNYTKLIFNDLMTTGLDPGYDVGKLKGNPELALYSCMKETPTGFAVQALPTGDHTLLRIPLGLECAAAGEIIFTATAKNLLPDMQILLEDTSDNSYHRLDIPGSEYRIFSGTNESLTGRFYIRTGSNQTGIKKEQVNTFSHYIKDGILHIKGRFADYSEILIYDYTGKLCRHIKGVEGYEAAFDLSDLPKGIYLAKIISNRSIYTMKAVTIQE